MRPPEKVAAPGDPDRAAGGGCGSCSSLCPCVEAAVGTDRQPSQTGRAPISDPPTYLADPTPPRSAAARSGPVRQLQPAAAGGRQYYQ